jgi:hypothetical protein
MLDFLSRSRPGTFGVALNSVRNLFVKISIKNNLLSSISGGMQAMLECQCQMDSREIQSPQQRID